MEHLKADICKDDFILGSMGDVICFMIFFFFNETTDIIVVLQCLVVFSVTKFCVNVKM